MLILSEETVGMRFYYLILYLRENIRVHPLQIFFLSPQPIKENSNLKFPSQFKKSLTSVIRGPIGST